MSDIAFALGTGRKMKYEAFIHTYHNRFFTVMSRLSETTRNQIRNNKELDSIYDCFIDFIIDTKEVVGDK